MQWFQYLAEAPTYSPIGSNARLASYRRGREPLQECRSNPPKVSASLFAVCSRQAFACHIQARECSILGTLPKSPVSLRGLHNHNRIHSSAPGMVQFEPPFLILLTV